ncbi:hypothetical protein CBR_g49410 [Chara braunii]|uniref:2Fe-2S ferredoxin-type domain-containing protein n=1 Tax=Chara braunii TaxID=69332 RepID=A0A388M512_CHABU|nr:hypothetical protein CBR_g49410 [Chara braunii]|eukprot:GBG89620.1 hypothetical protein CBR_g49410 [Chara braunii]
MAQQSVRCCFSCLRPESCSALLRGNLQAGAGSAPSAATSISWRSPAWRGGARGTSSRSQARRAGAGVTSSATKGGLAPATVGRETWLRSSARSTGRHAVTVRRRRGAPQRRPGVCYAQEYKVEILKEGEVHTLTVPDDMSILEAALDSGLELSHDCKLGVCMTCPAKLESGQVDQEGAMLSEDVLKEGYALLCVSQPRSDCKIRIISEDELLDVQLVTSQM